MKVRKWFSMLMVLLLICFLTACGGNSGAAEEDYVYAESSNQMSNGLTQESGTDSIGILPENRKLIKTVRMEAETEELDALLSQLDEKIAALGGYVETREVYNGSAYSQRRYRNADLTIRIPADQVDNFVEHVSGVSNIVSSNESVEDVTLQYVDTESRVKALETEQDRLLTLLEQAQSLEEILEIEARLSDVRYELERYASQLRTLENQVSYATIHLYISEVQEYTPVEEETVWDRIAGGFADSLKSIGEGATELLIWVLAKSPYLLIWGVLAGAVILVIRRKRNPRAKKAAPPEKTE